MRGGSGFPAAKLFFIGRVRVTRTAGGGDTLEVAARAWAIEVWEEDIRISRVKLRGPLFFWVRGGHVAPDWWTRVEPRDTYKAVVKKWFQKRQKDFVIELRLMN